MNIFIVATENYAFLESFQKYMGTLMASMHGIPLFPPDFPVLLDHSLLMLLMDVLEIRQNICLHLEKRPFL